MEFIWDPDIAHLGNLCSRAPACFDFKYKPVYKVNIVPKDWFREAYRYYVTFSCYNIKEPSHDSNQVYLLLISSLVMSIFYINKRASVCQQRNNVICLTYKCEINVK